MFFKNELLALALSVATAEAAYKGFSYGASNTDGTARTEAQFKAQFQNAKNLVGTSGFTSARLYTMIQEYTTDTIIEAIQAAIDEETSLLLGLWVSGGNVDNEITALKSAISTYGEQLAKLTVGISVGSEDMYRNSVAGAGSNAGPGVSADDLVTYIKQVREAISGTSLSSAPIGHVDTWDAWTNTTNLAVIDELDWLGFDGYPFWQSSDSNDISNAKALFDESVEKTKAVAGDKEVWITETGWAVTGDNEGEAVASIANAKKYWDAVGCSLFGTTNTWWYIMQDYGDSPSFGIVGETLSTTPLFDLSCPSDSSSTSSSSSAATASGVSATASGVSASGASATSFVSSVGHSATRYRSGTAATATSTPLIKASGTSLSASSSASGSSSSGVAAASTTATFNGAGRTSSSVFGAIVAFLALAIAV
ncbi:glycoside hydrolase [Penicillium taxi]|uniref:glycoside hydrolase n=1 Tax=Penicillium taxi TaxID=168475 RepID=UPI002545B8D9|nr:glycoside hydrolase [Penicillium taxi]KAJ5907651.1 glycoside hydrolase [Penicillium taxi]